MKRRPHLLMLFGMLSSTLFVGMGLYWGLEGSTASSITSLLGWMLLAAGVLVLVLSFLLSFAWADINGMRPMPERHRL